MIPCTNPNCRHRNKRKLRPLVITLLPPTTLNHASPPSSINATVASTPWSSDDGNNNNNNDNTDCCNNFTRQEQITHMFASHPSLVAHFEPPTFSPGVPSRELRNRLKFLDHCNDAGIIPDVEWEGICRAVREQQQQQQTTASSGVGEDSVQKDNNVASYIDQEETVGCSKSLENDDKSIAEAHEISKTINPFKYLAVETLIQIHDDNGGTNCSENNTQVSSSNNNKKKKRWLEYETKSLVPISPHRRGSPEDILLPYSMEIWRKAKTLNRDRRVLACTLAHLKAMKTLVSSSENENDNSSLDDDNIHTLTGKFDFILEDNVRAFVGMSNDGKYPEAAEGASDWSCECACRIWDIIEASNASNSTCHMRYYGWLGSIPNLAWIYGNHIPRSGLNDTSNAPEIAESCVIFPYPTNEDFEVDSIMPTSKSTSDLLVESPSNKEAQASSSVEASPTPQFTTPGGTAAVWGTFAYTVSPAAYLSFIHQLQNDVGSLMWKGKKMRAYKAKPIDKILPRHVKSTYGSSAVHIPAKVAFVRGPMVSLLHPQWDAGFCRSTESQYRLSCVYDENSSIGLHADNVWDHVWLEKEERGLVKQKKNGDHSDHQEVKHSVGEKVKHRLSDRMSIGPSQNFGMLASMMILFAVSYSDAFSFGMKNSYLSTKLKSHTSLNNVPIDRERKLGKIGNVSIISRTIPIDVDFPIDLPQRVHSEEHIYLAENGSHRLDVTVWELYQPSELIQEWWSIDRLEQERRMGDPFGVVMWPGSIMAAKELMKKHLHPQEQSSLTNATVLVLGAGTGVEALTAALLGAKRVIATDINPLTLKLLDYGANNDVRVGDNFSGEYFDLFSDKPLPECDVLIAADVLYNPGLAKQVGLRLHEAVVRSFNEGVVPLKAILTDSQQFHGTNFLTEVAELSDLNKLFKENNFEQLEWKSYKLENVCGSGVLVDEDQIYDADVRMISWGWYPKSEDR